jgi:serine/threonine-protein kinase HipA
MNSIVTLDVELYNKTIGVLTKLPNDQIIFAFDQSYIHDSSRAMLSLSFKDKFGNLLTDTLASRTKVPPFFSNLLPEGPLREYIAKSSKIDESDEFALLGLLGLDLPGAIKVIGEAKGKLNARGVPEQNQTSLRKDNLLKFSLAGVQLKFSAVENIKRFTIPTHGIGGSWILKLPSIRFANIAENEYSIMTLAKMLSINVPEIKLLAAKDIEGLPENIALPHESVFAIKRFDRTDSGPVHIEDFAQVFGVYPKYKYEKATYANIAEVIYIEGGVMALEEFIRRLVFNTLIGNADMHLKNWSLIYPDKRNATIAPAYDFVSTIVYIEDKTMALKYVKKNFMAELSVDLLSYLSTKARLPERLVLSTAKKTVQKFLDIWEQEKTHLLLSKENIQTIEKHFNNIVLVKEVRFES